MPTEFERLEGLIEERYKKGKLKSERDIDKIILNFNSRFKFERIPLRNWENEREDKIKEGQTKKELLKKDRIGFLLFVIGIFIGGSVSFYKFDNFIILILSILGIGIADFLVYKINNKIRSIEVYMEYYIPYILNYKTKPLVDF